MIWRIAGAMTMVFAVCANGQPAPAPVAFEVASVKPSAPPNGEGGRKMVGGRGGPGRGDPTRYTCTNCTLTMLVTQAYDLKRYQLNAPGWMDGPDRFDISAKIPDGATKEQTPLMLQNLLAERFKLTVHRDKKEMQVYDLVVMKGGPKFKEHVEEAPKEGAPDDPPMALLRGGRGPEFDKDGYPVLPKGCKGCMIIMNGKARMKSDGQTMPELAVWLSNQTGKPVFDATGLKGKYDFSISFDASGMMMGRGLPMPPPPPGGIPSDRPGAAPDSDLGVPIEGAIQSQLGLKLEAKKGQVDMIVVDHSEKVPTEN